MEKVLAYKLAFFFVNSHQKVFVGPEEKLYRFLSKKARFFFGGRKFFKNFFLPLWKNLDFGCRIKKKEE